MKSLLLTLCLTLASVALAMPPLPDVKTVNRLAERFVSRRVYHEDNRDNRITWRVTLDSEEKALLWEMEIIRSNTRTKSKDETQWCLVSDREIGHFVSMLGKLIEWSRQAEADRAPVFKKLFPVIDGAQWEFEWNGREGVLRGNKRSIEIRADDAVCFTALLLDAERMKSDTEKFESRKAAERSRADAAKKVADDYAAKLK